LRRTAKIRPREGKRPGEPAARWAAQAARWAERVAQWAARAARWAAPAALRSLVAEAGFDRVDRRAAVLPARGPFVWSERYREIPVAVVADVAFAS
jgi:hypothetical protein